MSRDDAEQDLHEDHRRHEPEVLDRRPLGGRGLPAENRVGFGHWLCGTFLSLRGVRPDHRPDSREQHNDAHAGPDHGLAGGPVGDQGLVRPVARVGQLGSRTVRRRRPRGPEEEGRQLAKFFGVALRPLGDGVVGLPVGEHVGVVLEVRLERPRPHRVHRDRPGGGVERVRPHQEFEPLLEPGLLLRLDPVEVILEARLRPLVEDEDALPVQPVGRPIGCDVAAVAPDRADLHAAHRLPHVLPASDIAAGNDHRAVHGDDPDGDGRSLLVDARADPSEDRKRKNQNGGESQPQALH